MNIMASPLAPRLLHLGSVTSRNPFPKSPDPPLMRYPVKSQAHPVPGINDILESLHHKFSCRNTNDCYYIHTLLYICYGELKRFQLKGHSLLYSGTRSISSEKMLMHISINQSYPYMPRICNGYTYIKGRGTWKNFSEFIV